MSGFRSVDHVAGLNLIFLTILLVHFGNEEHDSLRTRLLENCQQFSEMQIVRLANYV